MSILISVLLVIVCILLVLVVLVQNPKGGGLSSSFSSSTQIMGVRKTADFLEKATWSLAIALVALSLFSAVIDKSSDRTIQGSEIEQQIETAPAPSQPEMPSMPEEQ
ncbi:MAG: preprotein translocase subunit SecG [Bacteroidetes bacterium]|nr:preprotein translocase subunit SecG [Bacteroidota bacterium]HET6243253.1 preprotein translocase subunit SecG [Bacteroidia bacterium]